VAQHPVFLEVHDKMSVIEDESLKNPGIMVLGQSDKTGVPLQVVQQVRRDRSRHHLGGVPYGCIAKGLESRGRRQPSRLFFLARPEAATKYRDSSFVIRHSAVQIALLSIAITPLRPFGRWINPAAGQLSLNGLSLRGRSLVRNPGLALMMVYNVFHDHSRSYGSKDKIQDTFLPSFPLRRRTPGIQISVCAATVIEFVRVRIVVFTSTETEISADRSASH
jgi:hypothetical protein